jgi:hypothetical protein
MPFGIAIFHRMDIANDMSAVIGTNEQCILRHVFKVPYPPATVIPDPFVHASRANRMAQEQGVILGKTRRHMK